MSVPYAGKSRETVLSSREPLFDAVPRDMRVRVEDIPPRAIRVRALRKMLAARSMGFVGGISSART